MNAPNEQIIAQHTVQAWCVGMSESVKQADLDEHMAHISRRLKIYGVPSKEVIDYRDYKARRKYELTNEEILSLNYQKVRLISSTVRRLRFNTDETTVAKNGKMLILNKNILLEREDDGVWRVVEENVTNWAIKQIDLSKF